MKLICRNVFRLQVVGSTNKYVQDEIHWGKVFVDGDIIVADEQTEGKGLDTNSWESEPGKNLTFTIYLEPIFLKPDKQFTLNKAISLGIYDFINSKINNHKIYIKWPNDIYINDKKVAGILINNTVSGNEYINSIVGVGININQLIFLSAAPNPVSLAQILKEELNLIECLREVCKFIDHRYQLLHMGLAFEIHQDYLSVLYRINDMHSFIHNGKIIEARINGISEFGHLQLITSDNNKLECDLKEVEFIN